MRLAENTYGFSFVSELVETQKKKEHIAHCWVHTVPLNVLVYNAKLPCGNSATVLPELQPELHSASCLPKLHTNCSVTCQHTNEHSIT